MHHINKKLVATAMATALVAALGAAVAQTADKADPMATPKQQVDVSGDQSNHIYFFRDQGNSPETDPAAHLLLIKHEQAMVPVAERTTTTTTTVAEASTPAVDTTTATTMPAAADTSNTQTSSTSNAYAADTAPVLAPKADRN